MSSGAIDHVFRCSPHRGVLLTVLLAIADSANDQNGNEIWFRTDTLARKARVSRASVSSSLTALVQEGWLQQLTPNSGGRNRSTRYQFIHDESRTVVYETRSTAQDKPPRDSTVSGETTQILAETTQGLGTQEEQPKRTQVKQRTRGRVHASDPKPNYPTSDETSVLMATTRGERSTPDIALAGLTEAKRAAGNPQP